MSIVKKKYFALNFGSGGAKGTAASAADGREQAALPAGRLSWREILNWTESKKTTGSGRGQ